MPPVDRYGGPRLPLRLQVHGSYVLQVPGTSVVVDGASENSPFDCPRSAAIYANHSTRPNARVETWPVLRPGPHEVREHVVLVASEPIEAGREIRINYECGDLTYWRGQPPAETDWRGLKLRPPPPTGDAPVIDWLRELQEAAALRQKPPPCPVPQSPCSPMPWEGAGGGDARLHEVVPLLSTNGRNANQSAWPLVSTHVPGRSGRECRDRWSRIQHDDGWPSACGDGSHAEMAAAMEEANRAAAAHAVAVAAAATSEGADSECCAIYGCASQLLRCNGHKAIGEAVGCAESGHLICAPCLYRWFTSEVSLREEAGLAAQRRKKCPICQSELRATAGDIRTSSDQYVMGLLKVAGTW